MMAPDRAPGVLLRRRSSALWTRLLLVAATTLLWLSPQSAYGLPSLALFGDESSLTVTLGVLPAGLGALVTPGPTGMDSNAIGNARAGAVPLAFELPPSMGLGTLVLADGFAASPAFSEGRAAGFANGRILLSNTNPFAVTVSFTVDFNWNLRAFADDADAFVSTGIMYSVMFDTERLVGDSRGVQFNGFGDQTISDMGSRGFTRTIGPMGSSVVQLENGVAGVARVVPEPMTVVLLGTGLAGVGAAARRQRRARTRKSATGCAPSGV